MSELALEVKNVSKIFRMRSGHEDTLKGSLTQLFSTSSNAIEPFKALKNISFNVNKGEAIGIIGKNGAGKSTLLRLLSGIIPPNTGEVNFYGRAVSILDIGAGFHPELTGKENIFFSASLYGFSRESIAAQYDTIVEYSGIAEFIDQPVKHYSSGMYLRLAFAIITCLDADIYLIDEVINVGDANFQTKCKKRMEDLIAAGKTMIIASHNMNEIVNLCERILLLEQGEIVQEGGLEVIQKYMTRALPQHFLFEGKDVYHLKPLADFFNAVSGIKLHNAGIKDYVLANEGISIARPFKIYFDFEMTEPVDYLVRLKITDSTGVLVFVCSTLTNTVQMNKPGKYHIEFELPPNIFNERMYAVDFTLVNNALQQQVLKADKFLTFKMANEANPSAEEQHDYLPGVIKPLVKSSTVKT